jgi:hypothetical protein
LDFIPSDDSYLKHEGVCFVDQFVGICNKFIKKINRNWFIDKLNDMNGVLKLDVGVSDVWSIDAGVYASMLRDICKELDMSHYPYDASRKCFLRYVSKNQNYPALV